MKLYYSPGACSFSPHIVLREANVPFDLVKTDLKAKTTEGGKDFRAVNRAGYVPALELDDGTVITEGPVIVQYIADQLGGGHLAPPNGTLPRYKLQSWLNFVSTELHKGFSPLFNPQVTGESRAALVDRLAARIGHLDQHLADKDYIMGKEFSLPDAYAYTVLNWATPQKVDLSPFKNIVAYMDRISARPSVQAAREAEGLPPKR